MNVKKLVVLLSAVVALLLVGACGGGAAGGGSASGTPARGASDQAFARPAATSAGSDSSAQATTPSSGSEPPAATAGQRVQKNGRLTLTVGNGAFDASLDRVIALVQARGGYISGSQAQADSAERLRSGQVTFQVPADHFDDVISQLRRVGTAQDIVITGNDVSLQYVDLQARLRNAEAQRDAMLTLMTQARSVGDIIQVQNQLGQITGQIEQIKGQLAYIEHTTTYAIVAVTIREAAASGRADEWGLQTAALQGLHNFAAVLGFVLVALGTVAPLLIVAVVGFAAWRLRLRVRRA